MAWEQALDKVILSNSVRAWFTALGLTLLGLVAIRVLVRILFPWLKKAAAKTASTFDDFLLDALEGHFLPVLYFGLVYAALHALRLPPSADKALAAAAMALLTFHGARFLVRLLNHLLTEVWARRQGAPERERIQVFLPVLHVLVWGMALIFLLDNLGIKISAVAAGLGIGGIAVALAAQTALGDLFSYVAIVLDRPFATGDNIIVDDLQGTVEHIGIKTTRVRSLGGELLIFSNSNLISSRIRNYQLMDRRRVVFRFGLLYETPQERLKEVPGLVRGIIEKIPGADFERAHFFQLGESSLDFEVVYHVATRDYDRYMDIQQTLNLALKEELEKRGVGFAYPTRTLYVNQIPPR